MVKIKSSLAKTTLRQARSFLLVLVLSSFILFPTNAAQRGGLPYDEIREFARTLDIITNNYVEETEDTELIRDAIRGMLRELDPHSVYLDKRQKEQLQVRTQGQFGGLGIQVSYENNAVKVISPIDDTPAARAGIESLDYIITIDGMPTADMDLEQAVDHMRGAPGSPITLEISREGEPALLTFTLNREVIQLKSAFLRDMKDGYVYSRISNFQSHTARDYVRLLREKQQNGEVTGVILDLRNNPGGLLSSAIDVSDIFIDSGVIVSTAGRSEGSHFVSNANGRDLASGIPLLVMINGGSASASEIVAGAVQDHNRGLVVGTKSFGKGSVQSVIDISPTAAIKLTTARYMTPSGTVIDGVGIQPDIEVAAVDLRAAGQETTLDEYQERVFSSNFTKDAESLLEYDMQLWDAFELLQGLVEAGGGVEGFKSGI